MCDVYHIIIIIYLQYFYAHCQVSAWLCTFMIHINVFESDSVVYHSPVLLIKYWLLRQLGTKDMFTSVHVIGHRIDISAMRVISHSHYMFMTWLSDQWVEGKVVELSEAAGMSVMTVSGTEWNQGMFLTRPIRHLQSCLWRQNRYFKPKHDLFLTLTKWFCA